VEVVSKKNWIQLAGESVRMPIEELISLFSSKKQSLDRNGGVSRI
jgi:hypothetical protein